ncbi:Glutaminyl-peptide cyclotransferase [Porphyridium purpureum]|uniref:Glutaminyl-peptide cyclotransferase n=1 Tax=Porphyridium purpureum TaxID=35688 RepID=A0A5J4Z4H1_PORPP|nr:Glutaminyl-peptide cyclotransferase [Porphyridium purpureum]|eukprot:POR9556..scf295_1
MHVSAINWGVRMARPAAASRSRREHRPPGIPSVASKRRGTAPIFSSSLGIGVTAAAAAVLLAGACRTFYWPRSVSHGSLTAVSSSASQSPSPSPPAGEEHQATLGVLNAPVYSYQLHDTHVHDTDSFTQGLLSIGRGQFLESSGGFGDSTIRRFTLGQRKADQKELLPGTLFGEGIEIVGDKLYQITWLSEQGLIYDAATLQLTGEWKYKGAGWGLAYVPELGTLFMSNGTSLLTRFDPQSLEPLASNPHVRVFDGPNEIHLLNDMQYVRGELWANIFGSMLVARIDPATGKVNSWVDFTGILRQEHMVGHENVKLDVFNGIAFDDATGHAFVTGKRWPVLFEVSVRNDHPYSKSRKQQLQPFFLYPERLARVQRAVGTA